MKAVKALKLHGQASQKQAFGTLHQDFMRELDLLDHCSDGNLIAKAEKLQLVQAALDHSFTTGEIDEHFKAEVERRLTTHLAFMNDREKELAFQNKWIDFGYPRECLSHHPECVLFLMQSGFGFNLEMFKNSPIAEPDKHAIRLSKQGEPELLLEGRFTPWSEIKQKLEYDVRSGKVVSKQDPTLSYNYIDPEGIVAKDREAAALYPVAKIDQEAFKRLHSHAAAAVQPKVEECVMQIVTFAPKLGWKNWFTEKFRDYYPQHTAIRLIDREGNVYSFGLDLEARLVQFLDEHYCARAASGLANVVSPDWQEARRVEETQVTSWTISMDRLKKILDYVAASSPKSGKPFCFVNQNCNSFAVVIAALGGVVIDTKTSLSSLLWSCLPSLERVPLLGGPLSWIHKKVSRVVSPILRVVFQSPLFFIPRKVLTVAANSLFWLFGSGMSVQPRASRQKSRNVAPLLNSWWDLLDDEKCTLHHSLPLVLWQRRQPTTVTYRGQKKLSLCLLPPAA